MWIQKVGKLLFLLLIFALLIFPIGIVFAISQEEQAQYTPPAVVHLEEQAYGEPLQVVRRDIKETITLSGNVVSTQTLYQDLPLRDPYLLRVEVASGQAVQAGDIIGQYKGEPIAAAYTGVILQVNTGSDAYIQYASLEDLALECYVENSVLSVLQRENLALKDAGGNAYSVLRIDPIADGGRGVRVLLGAPAGTMLYGEYIAKLTLETGRVFPGALVIDEQCVYTMNGESQAYVRLVDAEGIVIREQKVTRSYSDGTYVCITGVEEGAYCDGGYKAVIEGGGNHAGA